MTKFPKCNQEECSELACVRYTWPGKDEVLSCVEHANKDAEIARLKEKERHGTGCDKGDAS